MARRRRRWRKLARLAAIALVVAIALDLVWIRAHWPDWNGIAKGPVPASRFMRDWEKTSGRHAKWRPVAIGTLPKHLLRAITVAEDAGFWGHGGFDVDGLREAWSENARRRRFAFGGSTISQQTAKNLFLTPSRTPLRKWHEAIFTWGLERNVSKRRILEIYLSDAELGPGLYGVEAAAQTYFSIPASQLSPAQSIELAASLPGPKKHNPETRTRPWQRRVAKITRHLERLDEFKPVPEPVAEPGGP